MSDIVLHELCFDNMYSYGSNNTIRLDAEKITQLRAVNGSGKTSIALILQEILFNKNFRSVKKGDILNRFIDTKTWKGSLTFSVQSDKYRVEVIRTGATSKVKLFKNDIDISEHKVIDTYKKISDTLNMSFDTFSQLTYQSSTDLLDFLKATDTNRKKFLIKLFNLQKYLEIGDSVKARLSEAERELSPLQAEYDTVDSFLQSVTIPEPRYEVDEPEIDSSLVVRRSEIAAELSNINDTCKRIDKNNMYKDELANLRFDMSMQKPEPFDKIDQLHALKFDVTTLKNRITTNKTKRLSIKINDKCPACGQLIDNSHLLKIKADIDAEITKDESDYNANIEKVRTWEAEFKKIKEAEKEYKENADAIARFEQLSQLIDNTIPSVYPNATELKAEDSKLANSIAEQTSARNSAIQHNKSVSAHNSKIEALKEQKAEFLIRQESLEQDILVKSSEISSLNILKKAFSPTGIVAFKLENLTKELENTINHYLSIMSDGQFQVEFKLNNEKLNIFIINNGLSSPIETVSGGEFSRIQTSVLLAIRKLLSKLGGSSINLLFLDEITGVLDEEGKEKLIEVLLNETELNVFLITHEYNHPLVSKIEINKTDNISSITS